MIKVNEKYKRIVALWVFIVGLTTTSWAQNGFSVYVGGNFPVGTFGQGGRFTDVTLNTLNSELGDAAIGMNVGLKYQFRLLGGLSAFVSADFLYNSLKDDIKKVTDTGLVISEYLNIPAMLGANYTVINLFFMSLWLEAGVGVNFCNVTGNPLLGATYSSDNTSYAFSKSFVWQAGIGVSVAKKLSLGMHYYGFGASDVRIASVVDSGMGDLVSDLKGGTLDPSMVVVRLGYHF
jgi:hypothetical protein